MTTQTQVPATGFAIPKFAQDIVAGTVGGWAQVVVGHPFDTIKVRMQTQPNPPIYNNAVDCFRSLVKEEGVSWIENQNGVTPKDKNLTSIISPKVFIEVSPHH
ncbi:hypothetical protein VKS41_002416 [Umbelopsis sp. WA50703]